MLNRKLGKDYSYVIPRNRASDYTISISYVIFTNSNRSVFATGETLADSLKNKIIPEMKNKHLHVIYKKFPDEVHGTIAISYVIFTNSNRSVFATGEKLNTARNYHVASLVEIVL